MRADKVTEYVKYEFTEKEAMENAKTLARKNRMLAEFDAKKKHIASTLKDEEDGLKKDIGLYARYVNDGYDYRDVECNVLYDEPQEGQKIIVRIDTGEEVATKTMTSEERQQSLAFAGQ